MPSAGATGTSTSFSTATIWGTSICLMSSWIWGASTCLTTGTSTIFSTIWIWGGVDAWARAPSPTRGRGRGRHVAVVGVVRVGRGRGLVTKRGAQRLGEHRLEERHGLGEATLPASPAERIRLVLGEHEHRLDLRHGLGEATLPAERIRLFQGLFERGVAIRQQRRGAIILGR